MRTCAEALGWEPNSEWVGQVPWAERVGKAVSPAPSSAVH